MNIQGDLNSDGNIRIDGNVKGTVSTKQNVQVGEKALILANITAGSAGVAGKIEGNLKISGQLTLLRTANIKGDVACQSLKVEDGAIFNGKCVMGGALETSLTSSSVEE